MADIQYLEVERKAKRAAVLTELQQIPSFRRAADKAGIHMETLRLWRRDDPAFDAECKAARIAGFEALEDEAVERGLFKGSDRLLMFMLAGYRPSIFGNADQANNEREQRQEPTRLVINDA